MHAPSPLPPWLGYPLAAVATGLLLAVEALAWPVFREAPFLLGFVAATAGTFFGGLGPGLFAIALFAAGVGVVLDSWGGIESHRLAFLAIFAFAASPVAVGGALLRRSRARADAARRTAEEIARELESVFESVTDGVVGVDHDWRFVLVNREAERLLGRDRAALIGRRLWAEFRQMLDGPFEEQLRLAQATGRPATFAARYLPLDRSFDVRAYPSARGVSIYLSDATERMELERAQSFLAQAGARLGRTLDEPATLAELARLAVPQLADFCVVELADEAGAGGTVRRVAHTHAEPAREALLERLPPPAGGPAGSGPELVAVVNPRALEEGPAARFRELEPRSLLVVPLGVRERVLGTMTFGTDTSCRTYGSAELELARELARRASVALDNARLYAEAQEAVKTRDEFLSVASHELKTPLTTLQLAVQSLLRDVRRAGGAPLPAPSLEKSLARIGRQVGRLGRLIQELLDVSRISAGRLELEPEPADLAEIVREVVAWFEHGRDRGAAAIVLHAPEPVRGSWDRSRLEQVVTNLLANAVKYGEDRPIAVRVRREGAIARLEVEDQGIGIPPADRERIFARFERAVSSREYGGLGLGLYICSQIASAHGGWIGLRPGAERGTIFTFEVPCEAAREEEARMGSRSASV